MADANNEHLEDCAQKAQDEGFALYDHQYVFHACGNKYSRITDGISDVNECPECNKANEPVTSYEVTVIKGDSNVE